MASPNLEVIIDGDGHLYEDHEAIANLMPPAFRKSSGSVSPLFPPLDHLHAANRHENPPYSFARVGPEGWLEFLEEVGIDTTVLYPSNALMYGKIVSRDWAIAVTRAYNDWLHQTYMKRSPRFKGMALIPMQEPEAAVTELRRAVLELGMPGAMLPSRGLKAHLGSREYWPVYAEANRLGCVLAVHSGDMSGIGMDDLSPFAAVHSLGHPYGLMVCFAAVVFNGICDKFPNLRWAFLEGGVAWLLMCMERFDRSWETHVQYDPRKEFLQLRPGEKVSQYIRRHMDAGRIFVGCEGTELEMAHAVKTVGSKPFVYSTDFPHEVNSELARHEIHEILDSDELTAGDKAAIMHGNAERLYRLTPTKG